MSLVGCDRTVLDAARDDEKFTFFQPDLPVAEIHPNPPFRDQKKLILVLMMMPDELALEFDQLDVLPIELAGDPWVPVVVDLAELFLDVYFLHRHPFLMRAHVI